MSDETKRFDPLGEDNEIDELIRSTREEIERMDRLYAGQPTMSAHLQSRIRTSQSLCRKPTRSAMLLLL